MRATDRMIETITIVWICLLIAICIGSITALAYLAVKFLTAP